MATYFISLILFSSFCGLKRICVKRESNPCRDLTVVQTDVAFQSTDQFSLLDCPQGFMEESHSTTELLTLRSPYEFRSRGLHLTCITIRYKSGSLPAEIMDLLVHHQGFPSVTEIMDLARRQVSLRWGSIPLSVA